jgi:mycofactocin precursor
MSDTTVTRDDSGARVEDEVLEDELLEDELLVEEVSIDGMCGVY